MKKGKCTNYGDCDSAGKIFDIEESLPFECPECHTKLQEVDGSGKVIKSAKKKKGNKNGKTAKILFIIIGAILIAGIVVAVIFALPSEKNNKKENIKDKEEKVEEVTEPKENLTTRNDTLVIKMEGAENIKNDSILVGMEDVKEGEEMSTINRSTQTSQPIQPAQTQPTPSKNNPTGGTKNLGYGIWTGSMQNGQPHGMGTMTYSSSHIIDTRDSKGRVAQPGEYIVGEWDNGHLVQGRWFKNDGTKEAVIIGKTG